jgi:hypothetical protein
MLDFLEEAGKIHTYNVDCSTIIGLQEDICDGLVYALLTEPGLEDVVAKFETTKEGNCTLGGASLEDGTTHFTLN